MKWFCMWTFQKIMPANWTQKFCHFILEETGSRHPSIQQWLTHPQAHNHMPQSLTVSHNKRAVWAHLKPVVQEIMANSGHKIDTLHVLSDGPVTQYRNKANCYLWAVYPTHGGWSESPGIIQREPMGKVHPMELGDQWNAWQTTMSMGGKTYKALRSSMSS